MIFNEISDKGQLNQLMQRRLNMTGSAPAPSLLPEIGPQLVLENDRTEWGYLKGEYLFARGVAAGAPGAGLHTGLILENAPNSGLLVVIERVVGTVASRTGTDITTAGIIIVNSSLGPRRDVRTPGTGRAGILQVTQATANLFARQEHLPANVPSTTEYVIPPGTFFQVMAEAAATGGTWSISWRERIAMPGELG